MIFFTKKSFDFNHNLNQWLQSARFKSANPDTTIRHLNCSKKQSP